MFKKFILFSVLFIALTVKAFAVNDVNIINEVNFSLNTADTAVSTHVQASAGGTATSINTDTNHISITLDNLSSVTFNTTVPGQYLSITKEIGSDDYSLSPSCPTTTVTLTGTGTQTTLRLEVKTTTTCISNVIITESGGTTNLSESGTSDSYTISLLNSPTSDVVITITPDISVTVSTGSVTFTPLTWNLPQTITVYAVDDTDIEGAHNGLITHSASSLDLSYNGVAISNVVAFIIDNDSAPSGGGSSGGGGTVLPISTKPKTTTTTTTTYPTPTTYECNRESNGTTPFTDIAAHWADEDITIMYNRCIIDGRTPTTFEPNDNASRAEMVKILLRTFDIPLVAWERQYEDVNSEDWFAMFVTKASNLGIVQGYVIDNINVFKPNQTITRAEALKVILKTKGIEDFEGFENDFRDVEEYAWYKDYISYASSKGLINGYTEAYSNTGLVKEFYSLSSNLELNDQGTAIRILREILNQLGYFTDKSNDKYDDTLAKAISEFQKSNEMDSNGELDTETRNLLLNSSLKPVSFKIFRPNANITRAEIAKITLLAEDL